MSTDNFEKKIISSTYGEQVIKPATEEDMQALVDHRHHLVLADAYPTYYRYKEFMKLPHRTCWRLMAPHQLYSHTPLATKVVLVAPGYNGTELWKKHQGFFKAWQKRADDLGCKFDAIVTFHFPVQIITL